MQHPFQVRVAHPHLVHMVERVADVVYAGTALPYALRNRRTVRAATSCGL